MNEFPCMAPADFIEAFTPALLQYLEDVYGLEKVSHPVDLLSQASTFFDVSYYSIAAMLDFIDYTNPSTASDRSGGADEVLV
jgi:hypothetical protein